MLSDFEFTEESIDISDFEFDTGLVQDHESKADPAIDHESELDNDTESDFDLTIVTMLSDFEFTEESIDISDLEFDNGLIQDLESKTGHISVSNLDSDSSIFSVMPIVQQNNSNDASLSEYSSKYSELAETSKSEESKINEINSNQERDFEPNACSEMAIKQTQNALEMLLHVPTTSLVAGGPVFDTNVGSEHDLESESRLLHDSEYEAYLPMVSESSTECGSAIKIDQNMKLDTDSKVDSELDRESVKLDRESLSELESPRKESKSLQESDESAKSADQGTMGVEEEESKTKDDEGAAKIPVSEIVANSIISSILDDLFGSKSIEDRTQSTGNACAKEHLADPLKANKQIPNANVTCKPISSGQKTSTWPSKDYTFEHGMPSRERYLCAQVVAAVVGTAMAQVFRELSKPENAYRNDEREETVIYE